VLEVVGVEVGLDLVAQRGRVVGGELEVELRACVRQALALAAMEAFLARAGG